MKMDDGLYTNISVHGVFKTYQNVVDGVNLEQDEPSYVPGIFAVYKKDRWSGIFGLSNIVGGGKVEFKNGDVTTLVLGQRLIPGFNQQLAAGGVPSMFWYSGVTDMSLDAEQTGLGFTLGGAFEINEMFSVALAARYLTSERKANGHVTAAAQNSLPGVNPPFTQTVDYEEEADGWGAVLGLNIAPMEGLNIGLRYESKIELDFDATVNQDTNSLSPLVKVLPALGINSGSSRPRDLPAILAGGVSYQCSDRVRTEANFTYYFNEDADWGGDEDLYDNGYDVGIAIEYAISDSVKGSLGYLYTSTGADAENMTPELPELDANSFGMGLVWSANDRLDFNVGLGHVFYKDADFTTATGTHIEYKKDITFLAFGIQYKWF
jgi:long-chain fatty acid transport protein